MHPAACEGPRRGPLQGPWGQLSPTERPPNTGRARVPRQVPQTPGGSGVHPGVPTTASPGAQRGLCPYCAGRGHGRQSSSGEASGDGDQRGFLWALSPPFAMECFLCVFLPHLKTQKSPQEVFPDTTALLGVAHPPKLGESGGPEGWLPSRLYWLPSHLGPPVALPFPPGHRGAPLNGDEHPLPWGGGGTVPLGAAAQWLGWALPSGPWAQPPSILCFRGAV